MTADGFTGGCAARGVFRPLRLGGFHRVAGSAGAHARGDVMNLNSWIVIVHRSALAAPLVVACGAALAQDKPTTLPQINVTDSRLGGGIVGASTTVITAQDIERAPEQTLPDILAREAGIQTSSFFGGFNAAGTTVDMRGFGVTGPSNTLILINGRRLNDWDLPGFDLSTIARNSIERIEITRGNSGAVLYGDGAIGGVINIVTKTGKGLPPSARIEGAYGSFLTSEGNFSANGSSGPFSAAVSANAMSSNGYRVNNNLDQKNGTADFRYATGEGSAFVNIGADDQRMRLPGERRIDITAGINQYIDDRRGTNTPLNYADKQGVRVTAGFTRMLMDGIELIVDGGIRRKDQQAGFFQPFGEAYVDTKLTTTSVTPRINVRRDVFGMPHAVIAGVDVYRTVYDSDRSFARSLPSIHQYDATQNMLAGYWQQTIGVLPTTDISFGGRLQRNMTKVRDLYDPTVPQNISFPQGGPLDRSETNHAAHIGIEHRFSDGFAVFGRAARSFRVPNVDERIGNAPIVFPLPPPTFDLKTQTSRDIEGGVRVRAGNLSVQSSFYQMELENELHLNPVTFANTNFDPTRRRGVETIATLNVTDAVRLKGNLTYTQAKFREGPFAGNFVPVVSRWTGSAALSWDIMQKYLTLDAVVRYAGKRFLDNDEFNRGTMMIPSYTVVDLRIGGEVQRFFWSFAVQNLFDRKYFDYGLDTSFTFLGTTFLSYSVYPLPGRTFMARAGISF
jgi:iron complex outermembrane recepter protein